MEEAPSPKKQKLIGAAETASSSSAASSSSSLSQEEAMPAEVSSPEPEIRSGPTGERYEEMVKAYAVDEPSRWWSDEETEEERKITERENVMFSQEALDSYNQREQVNFVLDKAIQTSCALFHLEMVYHISFTAKEDENSPSSPFFAETMIFYGGTHSVLNCVKLDTFPPDLLRQGCIYCPKDMSHPPVGKCEYGTSKYADNKRFYP